MADAHLGTTEARVSKRCFGAWRVGDRSGGDALDVSLSDEAFDRTDDTASN